MRKHAPEEAAKAKERKKAYFRAYYRKHRDRYLEYRKRSREKLKLNPESIRKRRENWRRYYSKKLKSDPDWVKRRLKAWRKANPEKWAEIMKRASTRGLHRNFYARHKERLKPIKRARRAKGNPIYGLQKLIHAVKRGERSAIELVQEYSRALAQLDEGGDQGKGQSQDRERRMPVRR